MDWLVGLFLAAGFLFFWGVWIFGYWLPMAKESQREFKAQELRDKAAREARSAVEQAPRLDVMQSEALQPPLAETGRIATE